MVDDQRHRQSRQRLLVARKLAAVELQLHVPAEIGDASRHRLQRFPAAAFRREEDGSGCRERRRG